MRAAEHTTRIHYPGRTNDFILFLSSSAAIQKWRKLSPEQRNAIPMTDVLDSFTIFTSSKHGNQGMLDEASKGMLENEFGTTNTDEVRRVILDKGEVKEAKARERGGNTNQSIGSLNSWA